MRFLLAVAASALLGWPGPVCGYVAFVDNSVVDLKWSPSGPCTRQEIRRDDATVATLEGDADFYRDKGLANGQTYQYAVCCFHATGYVCERASATTGHAGGQLYLDHRWDAGTYELHDSVIVQRGVTFEIGQGAIVRRGSSLGIIASGAPYATPPQPGGVIRIDGATLERLNLVFAAAGDNHLRDSTMLGSNNIQMAAGAEALVSGNHLAGTDVITGIDTVLTLMGNTMDNAMVSLGGREAFVYGNTITDTDTSAILIHLRGYATITGNTLRLFRDTGVGAAAIEVFSVDWPDAKSVSTIRGNTITGFPVGIRLGLGESFPLDAEVEENIITGNRAGVVIWGRSHAILEGNRVEQNDTGVQILSQADVSAHENCIAGNGPGLSSTSSLRVDATGNWWGAASGPRHPGNPGGTGDEIQGSNVDYDSYLTEDTCVGSPAPTRTRTGTRTSSPSPTKTPTVTATPTPEPGKLSVCVAPPQLGRAAGPRDLTCWSGVPDIMPNGVETVEVHAWWITATGTPIVGRTITFSLRGGGPGTLQPASCNTDQDGHCGVSYRAPTLSEVFRGGEGLEGVVVEAQAGVEYATTEIKFSYLEITARSPANQERNVYWEDIKLWLETNAPLVPGSVGPSTFRVRTRDHPSALRCDPHQTEENQVSCDIVWQTDNRRLGYEIIVELPGGLAGFRGTDGRVFRKTIEWRFFTLPELRPKILPVQVDDLSRYFDPTDLLDRKATVVRVHAGVPDETELEWVDAQVRTSFDGVEAPVQTVRFYPGELGVPFPAPKEALYRGNSANFYSSAGEVPILAGVGGHWISAEIEPLGQTGSPHDGPYTATVEIHTVVRGTPNLTYPVIPIAPEPPGGTDPAFSWQPLEAVALDPNLDLFGKQMVERLLPVGWVSPELRRQVLGVPYPWPAGTRVDPVWLAAWVRSLDARSGGAVDPAVGRKNHVYVVPGEWIRQVNQGDPIYHGPSLHVCLLGSDVPEQAIAHCLGHLHGLQDDVWFYPGTENPNILGPELKGYHLERDRVVNDDYSSTSSRNYLGPDYTFALMRSDLGVLAPKTNDVWIDLDNYKRIILPFQAYLGRRSFQGRAAGQVTVGGEIVRDLAGEQGRIDVVQVPAVGTFPAPTGGGEYRIRLRDSGGGVLATHEFSARFFEADAERKYASFLFTLPAPEGLGRLELLREERLLATAVASSSPPQVAVDRPMAGPHSSEIEVKWSMTDPDGDAVRCDVFYGPDDGSHWHALALGTTETRLTLDTAQFASCASCRVRVACEDGFYTTEADSAVFSAANPPQVISVWPLDGAADVPARSTVLVRFRDAMDERTINNGTFVVRDETGAPVSGQLTYVPEVSEAEFVPASPLVYGRRYEATLGAEVADLFGQALGADHVWSFRAEPSPYAACAGDCNSDGRVTVDELVHGVNIALGLPPVDGCLAFDDEGSVRMQEELIRAVTASLGGCPG